MQPENLELLVTREMPFDKHKGQIIADLSDNYLNWFSCAGGLGPALARSDKRSLTAIS